MSVVAERMPALTMLPDGRYTITAALPVGADLRYKFTLGDGFWNAEHNKDASFRLRQLIVPEETALVEDQVITWNAGRPNSITFDVSVPPTRPQMTQSAYNSTRLSAGPSRSRCAAGRKPLGMCFTAHSTCRAGSATATVAMDNAEG